MINKLSSLKVNLSTLILGVLIVLQYLNLVADLFPSYVQLFVFFLFLISIIKDKEVMSEGIKISIFSLIIFIVVFLRCILAGQLNMDYYSPFQSVIARYQFLVYPFIFCYVIKLSNKKKSDIFKLSLISILITVLVSFFYMIFVDPQAVRNTQGVSYFGVGDFQLMYAISIFVGPLLMLAINKKKNKHNKQFITLLIVFFLYMGCILMCNLVTTWVIAIISIIISMIISFRKKIKIIIISCLSIFILLLKSVIAPLLYSIADKKIFYWSTNDKIIAIANLISGDFSNLDTLNRRVMLINQSLTSFKNNPIFGIDFRNHVMGNIGCHSQWFDDLARYGIFGNIFIILNYFYVARYSISRCVKKITKNNMLSVWISFLILGFLNPCLSGTILMIIFVVIPTFDAVGDE